jgi:hypothetical protein
MSFRVWTLGRAERSKGESRRGGPQDAVKYPAWVGDASPAQRFPETPRLRHHTLRQLLVGDL